MTTAQLEAAIQNIVNKLYNQKYTGELKVEHSNNMFNAVFRFSSPELPILIGLETNDPCVFLKYVEQELRNRSWNHSLYYGTQRVYRNG